MSTLVKKFFEETDPSLKLKGLILKAKPVAYFDDKLSYEEADDRSIERWEAEAKKRHWRVEDIQPISINFENGRTRVDGEIKCYIPEYELIDPDNVKRSIRQVEEEAIRSHFPYPEVQPVYVNRG